MNAQIVVFILAGGTSSRMGMRTPKALMPIGGRPMIYAVLELAKTYSQEIYIVVSGAIKDHLASEKVHLVLQQQPLGTGHAFGLAFAAALEKDPGIVSKKILVLLGDTPLVTPEDLAPLIQQSPQADLVVMGMIPPCPDGYGRMCVENGTLVAIVESKDATEDQKNIDLCNTGVMCLDGAFVKENIHSLVPSKVTKELYLTDLVARAGNARYSVGNWKNFSGINTRQQLAKAEAVAQEGFRKRAFDQGAYLMSPETTFLSHDTLCAVDVVLHPMVVCGPGVRLDQGVTIYSGSVLERCHIKESSTIGPFARIRPGSILGPSAHIGNFVETKNATIGYASQVKHLSYIGDAFIGDHVNVGAGVITCNYDGHSKNVTHLDDGVFVGSNTAFIAPVSVGKNATIGAGSVITKSVEPETLALSRPPQRSIVLRSNSRHLDRKHCDQKSKSAPTEPTEENDTEPTPLQ